MTNSSWQSDYSELESEYADFREQAIAANNTILVKHKADLERMQGALAEVDEQHFKELMNVQSNIDTMLDDVSTGSRGLYVRAEKNCSDRGSAEDSPATRMDDGVALVRLDNADAKKIFSIAGYGDGTAVILTGLQDYVRNVCLARN